MIWRNVGLASVFSVTHFVVYVVLFSIGFAIGDGNQTIPGLLAFSVTVLGTPLMFSLNLPPSAFGPSRWWGDDTNFILLLSAVNALLWGVCLTALFRFWQRRRSIRA